MTSMLLVTSNGAGMGHLSRQLAIGLASGSDSRPTLLSLSMALPQVLDMGVPGEYCPSHDRGWMPRWFWNRYLRTRIVALAEEVGAEVVLFDGVAPYRGLLGARPYLPDTAFVWLRRGMWLSTASTKHLEAASQFDLVVEPGDLAHQADHGPTSGREDALLVPPISMLEVVERLARTSSSTELGLDPDRPTVLLTLGSGRLGDVASPGRVALESLLEFPDWQVAVTTSAIATSDIPVPDPDRVVELRGVYPLVRHLHSFDAVVSAAGYNAVHEFVSSGLPTLLVPNRATGVDDQAARAHGVAERGVALVAEGSDPDGLRAEIRRLLDDSERRRLRLAIDMLAPHERMGGARRTAELATTAAARHRPGFGMRARGAWRTVDDAARTAAMSLLGARGTDLVRRAVRRPELAGVGHALDVAIVERAEDISADVDDRGDVVPLLFSDRVSVNETRAGYPVEHILPGAGDRYRAVRRRIIARNYRVREGGPT